MSTKFVRFLRCFQFACIASLSFGAAFGDRENVAILALTVLWICLLEIGSLRRDLKLAEFKEENARICLVRTLFGDPAEREIRKPTVLQ